MFVYLSCGFCIFILWFGWYGFNCGSTLGITDDNLKIVSKVGLTTTVGASAGGFGGLLTDWLFQWIESPSTETIKMPRMPCHCTDCIPTKVKPITLLFFPNYCSNILVFVNVPLDIYNGM